MSHLSCDCLQRCQGKSLRISNEITRNDCSQEGFPNEIDARALASATAPAPAPAPFSYSLALTGSAAVSVQRQALARIMAVVEDEAKMRRRHYAVDCHWAKTGVAGLVGCSTHPLTLRQALLVSLLSLSPPSACLAMTIAMQLTTMAARETRAMQSAGRKCRPEAQPELEQHEQELK